MSGNSNSGRRPDKLFDKALTMELLAAGDDLKDLRLIARMLLDKAIEGDVDAAREIINRTDGKPKQQVEVDANLRVTHDQWIERLQLPGSKE